MGAYIYGGGVGGSGGGRRQDGIVRNENGFLKVQ